MTEKCTLSSVCASARRPASVAETLLMSTAELATLRTVATLTANAVRGKPWNDLAV